MLERSTKWLVARLNEFPVSSFAFSDFYVRYFNFVSRKGDKKAKQIREKTFFICCCLTVLLLNLLFVFYLIAEIRLAIVFGEIYALGFLRYHVQWIPCFASFCNCDIFPSFIASLLIAAASCWEQRPTQCPKAVFCKSKWKIIGREMLEAEDLVKHEEKLIQPRLKFPGLVERDTSDVCWFLGALSSLRSLLLSHRLLDRFYLITWQTSFTAMLRISSPKIYIQSRSETESRWHRFIYFRLSVLLFRLPNWQSDASVVCQFDEDLFFRCGMLFHSYDVINFTVSLSGVSLCNNDDDDGKFVAEKWECERRVRLWFRHRMDYLALNASIMDSKASTANDKASRHPEVST